ncbi:MAG TPA: hypothetical protein VLM79_03400 [Kofleriaceae bacterium]|nr:hypothetical protein [Kofleriaceae bacterium]
MRFITMRIASPAAGLAAVVALLGTLGAVAARPAYADALPASPAPMTRSVTPMTRADGEVCDLLRAQVQDRCKRVAREGTAAVYQSGSKAAGVRRLVLAIDTGRDVLIGPAVDVLSDELESTQPTLRPVTIDGRAGVALHVIATWKRGKARAAERAASLVGCAPVGAIWKCSLLDVGACDATLAADGSVTTSCGASASLSIAVAPGR